MISLLPFPKSCTHPRRLTHHTHTFLLHWNRVQWFGHELYNMRWTQKLLLTIMNNWSPLTSDRTWGDRLMPYMYVLCLCKCACRMCYPLPQANHWFFGHERGLAGVSCEGWPECWLLSETRSRTLVPDGLGLFGTIPTGIPPSQLCWHSILVNKGCGMGGWLNTAAGQMANWLSLAVCYLCTQVHVVSAAALQPLTVERAAAPLCWWLTDADGWCGLPGQTDNLPGLNHGLPLNSIINGREWQQLRNWEMIQSHYTGATLTRQSRGCILL